MQAVGVRSVHSAKISDEVRCNLESRISYSIQVLNGSNSIASSLVAQRKSAGLITRRSTDRNRSKLESFIFASSSLIFTVADLTRKLTGGGDDALHAALYVGGLALQ